MTKCQNYRNYFKKQMKLIQKPKPISYFLILCVISLIIILYVFYFRFFHLDRLIKINLMFFLYDFISLFGLYWRFEPQYCSPMKYGFKPVMPLEFYAEFNQSIFSRIPSGNNNINKPEIIKICDRNLHWLQKNGKKCIHPTKIDILYVNTPHFKEKMMTYH